MKRATRGLLSFVTAFLIVFSTFGNAFLVAEASEPTAIEQIVEAADSASTDVSTVDAATDNASAGVSTVVTDAAGEDDTSEDANENSGENDAQNTSDDAAGTADTANTANTSDATETATAETVNLVVNATLEDGYVTLTCDVEGSTIYYSINEAGDAGYTIYEDRISIDTTQDTVIWAYASYDSDTMDAVDGDRIKFEFPAKEAVEEFSLMRASKGADDNGKKATSLSSGDTVIIAVGNRALTKNTASNTKLDSVEITVSDGVVTSYDGAAVFTVEALGDYFAFKNDEGKYLATPSATSQGLVFADEVSSDNADCGKWVLENADEGHFNVKSNTVLSSNNKYQYLSCKNNSFSVLTNNASNKKLCYVDFYFASETSSIAAPTASVESESKVEFGDKVELACVTEGATIKYSFDGENFKDYEEAVEITKDGNLYAYAELNGEKSDVAEFKYELFAGSRITDVTKLSDDQKFVITFGSDKAMSVTASEPDKYGNAKLEPAVVAVDENNHLTYNDKEASFAELTLKKAETEGQYYIVSEFEGTEGDDQTAAVQTKYLTTGATGSSLTFETDKNDYSLWTFEIEENGSFLVKNVNAVYHDKKKDIDKPQYFEFFNNLFTAYSYLAGTDEKDNYTFSAYTLPEFVEGEAEDDDTSSIGEEAKTLKNGDKVIMVISGAALSSTADGTKLAGAEIETDEDGKVTGKEGSAVLTVIKTDEYVAFKYLADEEAGTYKYLTAPEGGKQGLLFADELTDLSKWTLEEQTSGGFYVKNNTAVYKDIAQYIQYFKQLFTVYSLKDGGDAYLAKFYYAGAAKDDDTNTVGKLLTRTFNDGDKVVAYHPTSGKVMSSTAESGGLKGIDLKPSEEGILDIKDTDAVVLTVSVDDDGNYIFKTEEGKFLSIVKETKPQADGKTKDYINLVLTNEAVEGSTWVEAAADENKVGNFYLKSTTIKVGTNVQAFEYYNGDFKAFGFKEDPAYIFNFYAVKEGESTAKLEYDKDTELAVAQWAGNAHYDETENSDKYINGDLYATNDMLDKNAKFTAVVGGNVSKPWTSAKSTTTGSTSFYMGSTGVISESDYMELSFPSNGYGNMSLALRMRASNTAAGAFQLQYSTDGENFKNLKNGTYSYKYTSYKKTGETDENGKAITEPFEVSGSGDITDGIARTSLAPTYYVTFTFEIPNAAANAENVLIRLVPTGGLSAKGDKAPGSGGVIRMDSVKVTGNPVVDSSVTALVKADPASGEIGLNQEIVLSTATEGAEIYYSVNGDEFVKYEDGAKIKFTELPATISTYAVKEGLKKSITVNYQYTQAQVAAVKANPNGGAVFADQFVSFKTATEGATILYRFRTDEEIAGDPVTEADSKTADSTDGNSDKKSDAVSEETTEDEATAKSTDESTPEPAGEDAQTESEEEEQHDDWKICSGSIKLENLPCQIQVKAVLEGYKDSPVTTLKFTKRLNDKYNVYFGQIHAHTNISDGAGSLEDALKHASNVDNLDYIVITDHSNSIDNEGSSKITENVDKSASDEWTYAHNLVKQYSTDDFTCAYGYEMTWSNGLGHINTYNTPGFQSRTQTEYSTYATALQNYYAALRTVPDSISQFNHPGTTFGDFSDFAYYSEENDNLITMIEVGNGEGTIGSSGYFPSYEYYTRALDKGWHVAPTNNQDNHKGKWGDANTARTVMLADTNDEDAIYDAMRNYRIYATEDNDLYIYYTLEGNIMGSILEKDAVGDHLAIKADIKDPTDGSIGKVQVIVNGGKSIDEKTVDESEATVEFTVPSHYSYYYLKITQKDGNIAVTAPVWVGDVEACGINSTYTNTVLPVAGEPIDVNVDFYNNESKDLVINDIEIQLSDVDGKKTPVAKVTGEEAEITSVSPKGTATYKTEFVYNQAGKVTYEVTVNATLGGVEKTYTDKLTVDYTVPEMVADVIIDGTHYNDYVTGYYGGNMSAFISICASKNIRAKVATTEITPETLENCALLVLSAPAKKGGTANAGNYSISHYSDEFIAMVKDYVANGGSVIVCGLADYSDTADGQTATEQNKLLEAIGSTIRMGSDEVCDDTNNGGQVYRMYPETYNVEEAAGLFAGLRDGQKYSQYSGCSVDISNAGATDFVDAAKWLVKGFETTYSVDCKDASGNAQGGALPNGVKGIKNDNEGNVTFLATQHTKAGGDIYVAGGVFISDFEVKAEIDNADSLPFTNYTIINNILGGYTVELPVSTIAQARAGEMNQVFAVEGYVTSGTSNPDTTFFDTIYIQDETAGIDIFPYAQAGLEIGTKVRITGFVAQYQGDMELKVLSAKILDDEPYVWEPKVVDTRTAMDYATLGGSLLKTSGKVTRVAEGADGNIEEFWLADDTGAEAAIFIDGYIKSGTTGDEGKAALNDFVKVGAEVSAIGVLYMHPEGDSDVSVPVFRVRNCDDIVLIHEAVEPEPGSGSSGSGSETGSESGQGSESGSGSGTEIEPGSGSGSGSETGSESGSGSSDNGGNSGSGSSDDSAPQSPIQRVLGAIKQTVESVVNTVTDGVKNLVNRIFGRSNKNKTTTTTTTGTSEGEVVGSVTDITEDQTALAETPEQQSGDQPAITEQTGDNKTDTIVEEATATSDKPESKARKAAKAAATTVVVTSGLGLAAIGIRKLLLLLHVIK